MQVAPNIPQIRISAIEGLPEFTTPHSLEVFGPPAENIHWFDKIPQEVKKLIAPYRYAEEAEIKYANLGKLSEIFADKEIRTLVLNALQEAGPKLSQNGERVALIYALLKTPALEPEEVIILITQAGVFSRDKELYSLTGKVVERLGTEAIRKYAKDIVTNSLPEFLSYKCYGADTTFSGWENAYASMNSRAVAHFIYEELNERAIKGARSGYSHLINVLKKSELEISRPVVERLIMETADPQKAKFPSLTSRIIKHEGSALLRAAVLYNAFKFILGPEAFESSGLQYVTVILPHLTQIPRFLLQHLEGKILANSQCMDTKINLAHQCLDLVKEKAKSNPQARDLLAILSQMNFLDKKVSDYITVKE